MISVLLAEDHHLVRQGLRALLERELEFRVVGEVENGRDAVDMVRSLKPDIVVTDLKMPFMDGAEATRQIKADCPDVHVLVLSMYGDESAVHHALDSGASGFVLKTSVIEDLVDAIRTVRSGRIYVSPGLSQSGAQTSAPAAVKNFKSPIDRLSTREKQVLRFISAGLTSAQIAQKLNLSISTVEKHRLHIMDKLSIHDVPRLVRFAIKEGLIEIDS